MMAAKADMYDDMGDEEAARQIDDHILQAVSRGNPQVTGDGRGVSVR
jgi:hypothetical protein